MEEIEDVGGDGKSAKGKGDTPEGWMFLPLAGPLLSPSGDLGIGLV